MTDVVQQERQYIGAAIRRLRRAAGMSGADLAGAAEMTPSKISRIETGNITPAPDDIQTIATVLGAPQSDTLDLVRRAQALSDDITSWNLIFRDGLAEAQRQTRETEAKARCIRVFHPTAIPGLLQLPMYTEAVIKEFATHGEDDLKLAIAERSRRQESLYDAEREFHFTIPESVLYNRYAVPALMEHQIQWVATLTNRPNVHLSIIPQQAELPLAPLTPIVIYDDRVVLVETRFVRVRLTLPTAIDRALDEYQALHDSGVVGDGARALLSRAEHSYRMLTDCSTLQGRGSTDDRS